MPSMHGPSSPRRPSDQAIAAVVSSLAILGGAIAIGIVLWDSLGVMSAPISIAAGLVFVRLVKPVQQRVVSPPDSPPDH